METGQQYDLIPGLDISASSSVSKSELLQMIAQLAPLSNIGGILVGTGASSSHPDVTNNPRFIRYVWIDTQTAGNPVMKLYVGTYPSDTYADWEAVGVANSSITTAMITAASATGGVNVAKLKRAADGSDNLAEAKYLLRVDANGRYIELASANSVLGDITGGIALNLLSQSGASNGYVLGFSAGVPAWIPLATANHPAGSVPIAGLVAGTALYVLRVSAAGAVEWQTVNTMLQAGDVTLDKIGNNTFGVGAAAAYQVPQRNAANNATQWTTPLLSQAMTPTVLNAGHKQSGTTAVAGGLPTTGNVANYRIAHDLGGYPKIVRVVLKVISTGVSDYAVDDEIDLVNLVNASSYALACAVTCDDDYVYISCTLGGTSLALVRRNDCSFGNGHVALDNTTAGYFKLKVYAWI